MRAGGDLPLLVLPDAPPIQVGHCLSCGEPIGSRRWRCDECLAAINAALRPGVVSRGPP